MERNRVGIEIKAIDDATRHDWRVWGRLWRAGPGRRAVRRRYRFLGLDRLPGAKPLLFDHGQDATLKKAVIGATAKIEPDEFGLWVEAQLQR